MRERHVARAQDVPAGRQSLSNDGFTRRGFLGGLAVSPFAVQAVLAAEPASVRTRLIFDPETLADGRTVVRVIEVADPDTSDISERERQLASFGPPRRYELWLDAFGPQAQYALKVFDQPECYDLIFTGVEFGELRRQRVVYSFRQKENVWTVLVKASLLTDFELGPATLSSLRDDCLPLRGKINTKAARRIFAAVFDGHVRAETRAELTLDHEAVWRTVGETVLSAIDGAATLTSLEFYWSREGLKTRSLRLEEGEASESGTTPRIGRGFVARAEAQVGRIALEAGSTGPSLEIEPEDLSGSEVVFTASAARRSDNPRLEVRLSCSKWSATFNDDRPVLGPMRLNGTLIRQRTFEPGYKPGKGALTSTITAGIAHNVRVPIDQPATEFAFCAPPDDGEPEPIEPGAEPEDRRFARFATGFGVVEAVSPESEEEAGKAEEQGAARPFWVRATEDKKGRLVLDEANVSLLLRRVGTALSGASASSLELTDTSFQILFRRSGNLQLPAGYYWLGDPELIRPAPRARIDLARANLRVSRAHDLVSLGFRFSDLCLVYDADPQAESPLRIEPLPDYCRVIKRAGDLDYHDTRPVLVVEFPPQHVMEEALFRQELPPIPARKLEPGTDPDHREEFQLDAGALGTWWFRDPRKLATQLVGFPLKVRAKVRRAWFAATAPTEEGADSEPGEVNFVKFHKDFYELARMKPRARGPHVRALPEDQQWFIGPHGLDADGMAIARRVLARHRKAINHALVSDMFTEVDRQLGELVHQAINKGGGRGALPSSLEGALALEIQLESAVPSYQLFRDYYRRWRISQQLERATVTKSANLDTREIEYFSRENREPLKLNETEQQEFSDRYDRAIDSYKTALTADGQGIPEVVRGRLAEPSRLAFRVNCGPAAGTMGPLPETRGRDYLPFTLDGLTDWSRHELAVIRRAQRLFEPAPDGHLPGRASRQANADDTDMLLFQGFEQGTFVTPQQRLAAIVASLARPPGLWETSIDLPARLTLSTAQDASWRTPRYFGEDVFWKKYGVSDPVSPIAGGNTIATSRPIEGHPATLWATSIDPEADDPGLRAVHSPDLRPEFFLSRSQRHEGLLLGEGRIRLPGNGAPPRGPLAPWLIGREQLDTPMPSLDKLDDVYSKKLTPEGEPQLEEDCPPPTGGKKYWLTLTKYLHDRRRLLHRYGEAKELEFRTSLDAYDRHELVLLSSAYGLPVLGKRSLDGKIMPNSSQFEPASGFDLKGLAPGSAIYQPKTLNLRELTLTALGGTLRHDTSFMPPASAQFLDGGNIFDALSIERWQHWAVLGRDVFTEVVYKGFVFPLGHRASLVKLTERIFMRATGDGSGPHDGAVKAFLRQRMYIRVGKPDKEYPAVHQPNSGRQFPVGDVRILTSKTPDIVDPTSAAAPDDFGIGPLPSGRLVLQEAPGLAFWPRTAMTPAADVMFDVAFEGRVTRMPLIFVDNTAAHDRDALRELVEYYNNEADGGRGVETPDADAAQPDNQLAAIGPRHKRTVSFAGQSLRYCDERKEGDSSHETIAWTLKAHGRRRGTATDNEGDNTSYLFDPILEGADQPPFYPALQTARILLRQAERLTGRPTTPSVVQFDGRYVAQGFDTDRTGKIAKANPSEIYLNLVRPMPMTIGRNGDRTGGMLRPESDFVALSRIKGPMGGSTEERDKGTADEIAPDAPVGSAGTLVTRADAYSADIGDASGKLVKAYRRYFNLETKLLGLIPLDKLLKYMNLPTPEEGMPLLKEVVDYGVAQAGQALSEVDQATSAGRTLVQDEVIGPLLKVVQKVEDDWGALQKKIAASQPDHSSGGPITLQSLFPEIGDGLKQLRTALQVSAGITALLPFFESLSEVHEAGRQLIAGLKRASADPVARVDAALRQKLDAVLPVITGAVDGALRAFESLASTARDAAITLVVDAIIPPGNDQADSVLLSALFPSKPESGWIQNIIDAGWKHLRVSNGEARALLLAVLNEDRQSVDDTFAVITQRFMAAEDAMNDAVASDVTAAIVDALVPWRKEIRAEELQAINDELETAKEKFGKIRSNPFDPDSYPAALREDVAFAMSIRDAAMDLKAAVDEQRVKEAARTLARIIARFAGPLSLVDEIEDIKSSVNELFEDSARRTHAAIVEGAFCALPSSSADDACSQLSTLETTIEGWETSLRKHRAAVASITLQVGDDPLNREALVNAVEQLRARLSTARTTIAAARLALQRDAGRTRAVAQQIWPGDPAPLDLFAEGELAATLDILRQLATSKATLLSSLCEGLGTIANRAGEVPVVISDLIARGDALTAALEVRAAPPNPIEAVTAAIGALFAGPANAIAPAGKQLINDLKADVRRLDAEIAQNLARALETLLVGLNDLVVSTDDAIGAGESAFQQRIETLLAVLPSEIGDDPPLRRTIEDIQAAAGKAAAALDDVLDAVSDELGDKKKITTQVQSIKDLLNQSDWSASGKRLHDLFTSLASGLKENLAAIEDGMANLAEQAGRWLVGLGREVLAKKLGPVVGQLVGGFAELEGGASALYAELVAARDQAKLDIDGFPLPIPIKERMKQALYVPVADGVAGADSPDRLNLEAELLAELKADPALAFTSDAKLRELLAFLERWADGNSAPFVIAEQIEGALREALRGEWFKLIDVSGIRSEIERYLKNLIPMRARLAYTFGAEITERARDATAGIFIPAPGSRLDVTVAASVEFQNPENVKFEAIGTLGRFGIKLVGDLVDAVTINFHGARFRVGAGGSPTLNVMYDDFVIGRDLEFVQELQSMLTPSDGSGFYLTPRFAPIGLEAGYGLSLPIITLGNVSFSNISLNAAVVIPFDGSDARFRASLSRRDAPFTIAVAPYGGSGFFAIEANAEGIVGFEASFEFGGAAAFQFGPLYGIGRLMLGVYIKQMKVTSGGITRRSTEITGTFYVGGAAAIWIFTFGASLYVRLGMSNGNMTGVAIFTFSFSIGIADYDYSVSVDRTESKMGSGQQAMLAGNRTRLAAIGDDVLVEHLSERNEFDSWITNCTKCQGVDWGAYRSYFDEETRPPPSAIFGTMP